MFSTSFLYFLVAIFGESVESSEAHGLHLVEEQENETTDFASYILVAKIYTKYTLKDDCS